MKIGAPLVLQVKDSLAFFLVALLMFSNREARPSGKLAHWPFTWTRLLCGHGSHHVNYLPSWKLLYLNEAECLWMSESEWIKVCCQSYKLVINCGLTSSSGTPNFRSSCLAFLSESLLKSASVPVTVFLTGCGSLSSWKSKQDQRFHWASLTKWNKDWRTFGLDDQTFCWVGLLGTFT